MTPDELALVIRARGVSVFYTGRAWRKVRKKVLVLYNYECQDCKRAGKYSRATVVHHARPVKLYPNMALDAYYTDSDGVARPNLIPLCWTCHERREGRLDNWGESAPKGYQNGEKW